MTKVIQKFNRVRIVMGISLVVLAGLWMFTISRSGNSALMGMAYLVLVVSMAVVAVIMFIELEQLEWVIASATDRHHVLVAMIMIRNLEQSPGKNGEFDHFVFTFLIPCLRKDASLHADLLAIIPIPVMSRLAKAVSQLIDTERAAFVNAEAFVNRQDPKPGSSDFAAMAEQLKQLEDLLGVLGKMQTGEVPLATETTKFAPVFN